MEENKATNVKWNDDVKIHIIPNDEYFIIRESKQAEKTIKIHKIIISIKNKNFIKFYNKNNYENKMINCDFKLLVNFNDIYVKPLTLNFNNEIINIELNIDLLVSFKNKLFYEIEINENELSYSTEFFDIDDNSQEDLLATNNTCSTFDWFSGTSVSISYTKIH